MPKMKSHRAAKKRFRVSATGKIKREHANASHKFVCKPKDRKRRLRKAGTIGGEDAKRIRRMILA